MNAQSPDPIEPASPRRLDIDPGAPLVDVARRVAKLRLRQVGKLIASARRSSDGGQRTIHRLRVATRRAQVALSWFRSTMGRRRRKRMRKALRRLRHAADQVRNLDVLIASLEQAESIEPAQRATYRAQLAKLREEAARHWKASLEEFPPDRWRRRADRLIASIRWRGNVEPSYAEHVRATWARELARFAAVAGGQPRGPADLHRLRIAAKRLRYAAELAAPALWDDQFIRRYDALVRLQDDLGQINDQATAVKLLSDLPHSVADSTLGADPLRVWIEHHQQRMAAAQRQFAQRWPEERLSDLTRDPGASS